MLIFFSCEKDEAIVTLKGDGSAAQVTSSAAELGPEIAETLQNNLTIEWNEADYGANTEVKYTIEMDVTCDGFTNPVVVGTTTSPFFDITLDGLNAKLLSNLKMAQHLPSEVQVRVRSEVKGQFQKTSEPVTFTIKPWSRWTKGLWLLSNDWSDVNAPAVFSKRNLILMDTLILPTNSHSNLPISRTCDRVLYGGSEGALSGSIRR